MYDLPRTILTKANMTDAAFETFKLCRPMYAELTISGASGEITVRNDDIIQGSFSIDRYCSSGNSVEIGSAISSELKFTLNNTAQEQKQQERITIEGSYVQSGSLRITVTAAGMEGGTKSFDVGITDTRTAANTANEIRAIMLGARWPGEEIKSFFDISGIGADVILTAKTAAPNDNSMNISVKNLTLQNVESPNYTGFIDILTSDNTVLGKASVYDDYIFEGADVWAKLIFYRDATTAYQMSLGRFAVDAPPRKLQTISISALDYMMRFDKPYTTTLAYPATLYEILTDACTKCGVTLTTPLSAILTRLNGYTVTKRPKSDNLTYRQILQWIGHLSGSCAFMDADGHLNLTWFDVVAASQFTTEAKKKYAFITPAERYSSDMFEQDTEITGVRIVGNDEDRTEYKYGSMVYALNIEGNLLAQDNLTTLASSLGARFTGFRYRVYNCTIKSFPHLWPIDCVTYVDKFGALHMSVVTHHTFRLNGNSILAGKGETSVMKGYAAANPLTPQQQAILARLAQKTETQLTEIQQAQLDLNRGITNGAGLHITEITIDGITKKYWHDGETLEESTYISTYNSGGFAWTKDGWNNGNPVWQYGITADGNAILSALSVYKISALQLAANSITADKIAVGASDKNYIVQMDLSNWIDSTYVTPSVMVDITDSPVGGIIKARKVYSTDSSAVTVYAPSADTFNAAGGETYVYEGYFKASVSGIKVRTQISERDAITGASTGRWIFSDYFLDYIPDTWTKFSSKLKIPADWSGRVRALMYLGLAVNGNVQFTGLTLRKANSGAIIVDGRVESVDRRTFFDLSDGTFQILGDESKLVLSDYTNDYPELPIYAYSQGLFYLPADYTGNDVWSDSDAYIAFLRRYTRQAGLVSRNVEINSPTNIGDISLNAGRRMYLFAAQGIDVQTNLVLDTTIQVKGKTTGGDPELLVQKSSANNTVVGQSYQTGNTNIYTKSGGRINFYVGGTLAAYVDSDGYHDA